MKDRDASSEMSRRSLLLGGLMFATAAAATTFDLRRQTRKPIDRKLANELPVRIDDWTAADEADVVRPAEQGAASRYDQEVSRVFVSPGQPAVMLLVAYGSTQSDTLQIHRPEFCYPAAGFSIRDPEVLPQQVRPGLVIPATFFTAVRGDRVEQVLYWVRLGTDFPPSWASQHWARIRNSLSGIVPDGILVRASVIDPDRSKAATLLGQFLVRLANQSSPIGEAALLGQTRIKALHPAVA